MVQARKEMQALASEDLRGSLFGFEGADKKRPPSGEKESVRENKDKVFFAYFLFQKKVCAFSSVGRATDS